MKRCEQVLEVVFLITFLTWFHGKSWMESFPSGLEKSRLYNNCFFYKGNFCFRNWRVKWKSLWKIRTGTMWYRYLGGWVLYEKASKHENVFTLSQYINCIIYNIHYTQYSCEYNWWYSSHQKYFQKCIEVVDPVHCQFVLDAFKNKVTMFAYLLYLNDRIYWFNT